ncbi:uncharacterized WD repeat-containing protein alr3466, partial [Phtheirospermum japonicum]
QTPKQRHHHPLPLLRPRPALPSSPTTTTTTDNLLYSPSRSSTNFRRPQRLLPPPPPSPRLPGPSPPTHTPPPSILYHCVPRLHRHDGVIFSVAASSKGLVFTGSESRRVRAWRQPDCTERGYLKSRHGDVRAILAHGNTLFTAHKDCKIRVWNVAGGGGAASPAPENFQAKKITTLPKNRSIFAFPRAHNGARHKDCISCMAYNHAEGILYTGSWDRTIKAWRISDNRCVDSFVAHEDQINSVVVNQDDGCVFTCSSDGSVKIWRRVYGQSSHTLTMTLKFQPSPVNALALSSSPGSCFLYSGSSDGFINFWEKEKMSGRFNHGGFLQGHRFSVLCLAAIEKLVFSGSEDTTIRVWRREEGSCFHECLAVLDAHRGPVKCLAAVLEIEKVVVMGFLVYSAGLDQTFKVWRVKVLPEEKGCEPIETAKMAEYEMSPVLSPSWVEKKLQGDNPFH